MGTATISEKGGSQPGEGSRPDKAAPAGCLIKGNINKRGEHIYHLPTWPDYPKVKMDLTKGKVWFCSEGEAIKAGWRPAL